MPDWPHIFETRPPSPGRCGSPMGLDELCRLAAQELLALALEAEREEYIARHAGALDEAGRRLVVGNGYARQREITTAAGRVAAASATSRRSCRRICAARRR